MCHIPKALMSAGMMLIACITREFLCPLTHKVSPLFKKTIPKHDSSDFYRLSSGNTMNAPHGPGNMELQILAMQETNDIDNDGARGNFFGCSQCGHDF